MILSLKLDLYIPVNHPHSSSIFAIPQALQKMDRSKIFAVISYGCCIVDNVAISTDLPSP